MKTSVVALTLITFKKTEELPSLYFGVNPRAHAAGHIKIVEKSDKFEMENKRITIRRISCPRYPTGILNARNPNVHWNMC